MPLTEVEYVEHMAQKQIRYETIFEEQAKVFRTDQDRYFQANKRLQQTSFVVKSGQRWQPTPVLDCVRKGIMAEDAKEVHRDT